MNQHPTKVSRNEEVVAMRLCEKPWREIAAAFNLSIATVRIIYSRYRSRIYHDPRNRFGVPNEDRT